jgi:hypothetical protein
MNVDGLSCMVQSPRQSHCLCHPASKTSRLIMLTRSEQACCFAKLGEEIAGDLIEPKHY